MTERKNQSCINCQYYVFSLSQCRRHSPSISPSDVTDVVWPTLYHSRWCGDWELEENPEAPPKPTEDQAPRGLKEKVEKGLGKLILGYLDEAREEEEEEDEDT